MYIVRNKLWFIKTWCLSRSLICNMNLQNFSSESVKAIWSEWKRLNYVTLTLEYNPETIRLEETCCKNPFCYFPFFLSIIGFHLFEWSETNNKKIRKDCVQKVIFDKTTIIMKRNIAFDVVDVHWRYFGGVELLMGFPINLYILLHTNKQICIAMDYKNAHYFFS